MSIVDLFPCRIEAKANFTEFPRVVSDSCNTYVVTRTPLARTRWAQRDGRFFASRALPSRTVREARSGMLEAVVQAQSRVQTAVGGRQQLIVPSEIIA